MSIVKYSQAPVTVVEEEIPAWLKNDTEEEQAEVDDEETSGE